MNCEWCMTDRRRASSAIFTRRCWGFRALGNPRCSLRALSFTPTFHKHAGQRCFGVQVHVTDARAFRPYHAYLRLLAQAKRLCPDFAWRTTTYEFVSDRPAIDLLTGGPQARSCIDAGHGLEDWLQADAEAARHFASERREDLLY